MATKIGSALRAARKAKGFSIRDLERPSGMSSSQISQIESGIRKDPAFSSVSRLARAIGVSLEDLNTAPRVEARKSNQDKQLAVELAALHAESSRTVRRVEKLMALLGVEFEN